MSSTRMTPRFPLMCACLMLGLAISGRDPAAATVVPLVVFGTSLSDPGNAFALNAGINVAPDYAVDALLVPSHPYGAGGHHFSNGATWIEQFARSIGSASSAQPAYRGDDRRASNFAVGAARAYDDAKNLNLSEQVDEFLARTNGVAAADALYVIEFGGNDVRDAINVAVQGGNPGAVMQAALTSIATSIGVLYQAGARRFLIWNVPNVALTPALRTLDARFPGLAMLAAGLTVAFNAGLNGALDQLEGLPGIDLRRFDAFQKLNDLSTSPEAFGLVNVTTACITPGVAPFACDDPDRYLFWDGIHPTRAVHALLALEASTLLSH